jgi:hypothetical protein
MIMMMMMIMWASILASGNVDIISDHSDKGDDDACSGAGQPTHHMFDVPSHGKCCRGGLLPL